MNTVDRDDSHSRWDEVGHSITTPNSVYFNTYDLSVYGILHLTFIIINAYGYLSPCMSVHHLHVSWLLSREDSSSLGTGCESSGGAASALNLYSISLAQYFWTTVDHRNWSHHKGRNCCSISSFYYLTQNMKWEMTSRSHHLPAVSHSTAILINQPSVILAML